MERGYRVWKIRFDEAGLPRLYSVAHSSYEWIPGENVSSLTPEENIETSSSGFYSLKSPAKVKEEGYYPSYGRLLGEIIPYGRTFHGSRGFRSEKAEISNLFIGGEPCDLCRKEPGKFYFNPVDSPEWVSCGNCISDVKRTLPKGKDIGELELDDVRTRLYRRFNVDVKPIPPELLR